MACHLLMVAGLEVNSTPKSQVVPVLADATIAVEVMRDESADPSIEMMAPQMNRPESPLEGTPTLPAASTPGMSVTETVPRKEPPQTSPISSRPMTEGAIVNSDSRPAAEASAATSHRQQMASSENFMPQDRTMAMESNPVTTAGKDVLGAYNSAADQETRKPPTTQESSAIDWIVPAPAAAPSRISFDEFLTLSEITFEWSDSYDDKDWRRLRAILAPTLTVDYTEVNGHKWDAMTAEDFVGIMSHIGFVGDPLVHTQHHIGASKWEKISDEEVVGHHQLRAAHQRYTSLDLKTVENKGHGHAMVKHLYKKINGEWKLAGLRPTVRWNEFEFEKIFKGL